MPLTSDIFSVGTASTAGGCVPQIATTDGWVAESYKLHEAVETAYANWATDGGLRLLFTTYLGIQFSDIAKGVMDTSETNSAMWKFVLPSLQLPLLQLSPRY